MHFGWLAGALLLAGSAAAQSPGRIEATLGVGPQNLKLDHVLVVRHGNEEGLEDGPQLRIYATDGDLPLKVATGAGTLRAKAYARQNKINGVVITADPDGKSPAGVANLLYAPGAEPGSFASSSSSDAFKQLTVGADRASGSAAFKGEAFSLTVNFDAPVIAVPITADLKGKAAVDSPQGKALVGFFDALQKGDFTALGKYATASRVAQLQEFRTQAGEKLFREALKQAPTGAAAAKAIRRVIVRGTGASVLLESKEVDELVLEGDAWKMD